MFRATNLFAKLYFSRRVNAAVAKNFFNTDKLIVLGHTVAAAG